MEHLTLADVRRLFLRAQCLLGAADRRGGVPALLRAIGAALPDTAFEFMATEARQPARSISCSCTIHRGTSCSMVRRSAPTFTCP